MEKYVVYNIETNEEIVEVSFQTYNALVDMIFNFLTMDKLITCPEFKENKEIKMLPLFLMKYQNSIFKVKKVLTNEEENDII